MAGPRKLYGALVDLRGDSGIIRLLPSAMATGYALSLPDDLPTVSGSALVCDTSGTLSWASGGASTAWSSLTDPVSSLSLLMGSYATTLTFGDATGPSDMLYITDTPANTGSGALLAVSTAANSTALTAAFRVRHNDALRIGYNTNYGVATLLVGETTSTHSTTYGLLSFGSSGNDRTQAIMLDDSDTARAGIGATSTSLRLYCTNAGGHTIQFGSADVPSGAFNQAVSIDPNGVGGLRIHGGRRLRLYRPGDTQYVELQASVTASGSYTITLPQAAPGIANSLVEFTASGAALFTVDPSVRTLRLNTTTLGTAARLQINTPVTTIDDALAVFTPPNTATSALALQWAGTPATSPPILAIYRSDGSLWMGFRAGTTSDIGIRLGSTVNAPMIEADATTLLVTRASGGFAPLQSGQLTVIGEAYVSSVVTGLRLVTNTTSNVTVAVNQFTLNTLYTNNGATGEVILSLPSFPVAIGARYGAYVRTAQFIRFQAGAGTQIQMLTGGVTASGGFVRANTVGAYVELVAVSTSLWVATAESGIWLVDT